MKHFFILSIFLLFSIQSPLGQESSKKTLYFVGKTYMENCEKGIDCIPLTVTRYDLKDSIEMIFPSGGTQTTVYLFAFDSAFKKWAKGGPEDFPMPARQITKNGFESKPSIDLTGLPDDIYSGLMLGCNPGGGFGVIILTKPNDLGYPASVSKLSLSYRYETIFTLLNKHPNVQVSDTTKA